MLEQGEEVSEGLSTASWGTEPCIVAFIQDRKCFFLYVCRRGDVQLRECVDKWLWQPECVECTWHRVGREMSDLPMPHTSSLSNACFLLAEKAGSPVGFYIIFGIRLKMKHKNGKVKCLWVFVNH